MINVSQSFHRTSANAVDDTLTLTKAEMLAVNDNLMPSKYLTVCQDDGFIYLYDKSATPNGTTGKFTKFEGGSGVTNYNDLDNRPQIEGVTLTGNKTAANLGLAKTSDLPSVYEGSTAGLVPAAGSDNEGKYLDNDGNWTVVPMPMIGTINRSDIYDTTEKVVGKWTDSRPLYQRTFTGTISYTTANNRKFTALGLNNIDNIASISGYSYTGTAALVIPYGVSGDGVAVFYDKSSHDASIVLQSATTGTWTYYLTIQYTKTTDAANSYNYADENDYSTSEKIIGKWIGGETLYQKVVVCDTMTQNNHVWQSKTSHNVSNVDKWVSVEVIGNASGGTALSSVYFAMDNSTGQPNGSYLYDYIDSSKLWLYSATDRSAMTFYAILKYTKS